MSHDKDVKLAMYPGQADPLSSKTLLGGDRDLPTSSNATPAKASTGGFSSDAVKKIWPGASCSRSCARWDHGARVGRAGGGTGGSCSDVQ
mgnify:CR=1 FL=1